MGIFQSTAAETPSTSTKTISDPTKPPEKVTRVEGAIESLMRPRPQPQPIKIPISVGIDLGTTYSSIGYTDVNTGKPKLITFTDTESIPSWIRLVPSPNNENEFFVYVGTVAQTEQEGPALYDSKRLIHKSIRQIFRGDDCYLDDEEMAIATKRLDGYPFEITMIDPKSETMEPMINQTEFDYDFESDGIVVMKVVTPTAKSFEETFFPETVSALILFYLLKAAEKELGDQYFIDSAVISVPSEYNETEKKIIKFIGELCEIPNVTVREESVCALTTYLQLDGNNELPVGSKILIIDFGGGTLDITCCCKTEFGFENYGTGGDKLLGGNDFDDYLGEHIMKVVDEFLERRSEIDPEYSDKSGYYKLKRKTREEKKKHMRKMEKLKKETIRIKHELSDKKECMINVAYLLGVDHEI